MNDRSPNIWQLQAQGDSKGLTHALQNPDAETRKRAAAALRILGAVESIPALRRAIEAELDDETRAHLELALAALQHDQQQARTEQARHTRQLVAQLKSSDPAVVIKAAHALGRLSDKTAVEALILIFNDAAMPPQVRLTAAEVLIELQSPPAVVTLLAALKNDSWQTRRNAAAILGQLQADWAVARLADRLQDEHPQVQRTARAALKRIGTPQAIRVLEAFARQQARRKRKAAAVPPDQAKTQESPAIKSIPETSETDTPPSG